MNPEELKKLQDELQAGIRALREMGDRAEQERKRYGDSLAETKAAMDKIKADLQAVQSRLDQVETKAGRPPLGGPGDRPESAGGAETKAFTGWMRKGIVGPEEAKALATDDDTTGGYTVPTVLQNRVIEQLVLISPIRRLASAQTISGGALEIPKEDGQFNAGWTSERGARAETGTASFGLLRIPLHEMYAAPRATQTMLDDSNFDVEAWIARKLAERFAQLEGVAFVSGDGVGKPEGLLTAPGVGEVVSGSAAAITTDGMRRLAYGLADPYVNGAVYLMKRATELELALLKDNNGQYLWRPSLQTGAPNTFDGIPIENVPDMPAIAANAYPVVYGNIREAYQIADKATTGMLRDPYSAKPFVEFYTTRRVGGQVLQPDAFKKLKISA